MRRPSRTPAIDAGCQNNDAFMLFLYRSDDGSEEEWVWNSRDGVTPFMIYSRDKQKQMQHVEWHRDRFAPDHMPKLGDRIFVSLTEERAREIARKRVEAWWDAGDCPMRERFATQEEAVEALWKGIFSNGEAPALEEVTPEVLARIHAERRNRGFAKTEKLTRSIAHGIGSSLPAGYGFALVVFDFEDKGRMTYVSNAERPGLVKLLRELATKLEGDA